MADDAEHAFIMPIRGPVPRKAAQSRRMRRGCHAHLSAPPSHRVVTHEEGANIGGAGLLDRKVIALDHEGKGITVRSGD